MGNIGKLRLCKQQRAGGICWLKPLWLWQSFSLSPSCNRSHQISSRQNGTQSGVTPLHQITEHRCPGGWLTLTPWAAGYGEGRQILRDRANTENPSALHPQTETAGMDTNISSIPKGDILAGYVIKLIAWRFQGLPRRQSPSP